MTPGSLTTQTPPARTRRRTRIQQENEAKILDAALDVFSVQGFRGATVDAIARAAGMSKPNLLYYFARKEEMYVALLTRLLDQWLEPLKALDPEGDPIEELRAYIRRKLEMARTAPRESRLFANEIVQGAPHIGDTLRGPLRKTVEKEAAIIQGWIDAGRLGAVDPTHLIFAIWATTQHYADFDAQIHAVLGSTGDGHFENALNTLEAIFLTGLQPR